MRLARPAGDAALLVSADGIAARLASAIRVRRLAAVLDVIPGARTVLVITEPGSWDLGELATLILALPLPAAAASGAAVRIAVIEVPPDNGAARRPALAVKNPGNVSLFRRSRALDRLTRR